VCTNSCFLLVVCISLSFSLRENQTICLHPWKASRIQTKWCVRLTVLSSVCLSMCLSDDLIHSLSYHGQHCTVTSHAGYYSSYYKIHSSAKSRKLPVTDRPYNNRCCEWFHSCNKRLTMCLIQTLHFTQPSWSSQQNQWCLTCTSSFFSLSNGGLFVINSSICNPTVSKSN